MHDRLPTVSWILPTSYQSEHPDYMPAAGADYVASKVNAIAANPDVWAKTVFVLIYDENDGFFDHVNPPTAPDGHRRRVHHRRPGQPARSASASGCRASSSPRGRSAATSATTRSTTRR